MRVSTREYNAMCESGPVKTAPAKVIEDKKMDLSDASLRIDATEGRKRKEQKEKKKDGL